MLYIPKDSTFCFLLFQEGKQEDVEPSDEVTIDNSTPKKSNLKYSKPQRKDTGEYTITVTNKHGTDSADIEVVVLGMWHGIM